MANQLADFWLQLKRRRVIRSALAYFVIGWILIEVTSVIEPTLMLPEWTTRLVTVLVLLGFPLTMIMAWIFDVTPTGIERTPANDPELALPDQRQPAALLAPPDLDDAIASVAVLPFECLSSDERQRMLAEGLATEIHSKLSKLHRVRVAARRAAFNFGGLDTPLKEVAATLQVRYVLSGNLLADGDRVRIIAELDDASDDSQIWSERFERNLNELLPVMEEIADAVVAGFGGERFRAEMDQAKERDTDNLDAWQLVQKARGRVLEYTSSGFDQAEKPLARAIELDSNYAAARAMLGSLLGERILNACSDDIDADSDRARQEIATATELAPQDSFVLKMSGMVWATLGEASRAADALKAAVGLAPYDFGAWGYLGWPLTARGRSADLEELNTILTRVLSLAPSHPGAAYWLHHRAVALTCAGDPAAAVEFSEQAVKQHSSISWGWLAHANILGSLDRPDQARRASESAKRANPQLSCDYFAAQIARMSEDGAEEFVASRTEGLRRAGLLSD